MILGLEDPRVGDVPDGGDADAAIDAAVDAPPGPDVVGTSRISMVQPDGTTVEVPEDLAAYTLQAFVPDADEPTGFRVIDGQGTAEGTFVIPDVPQGTYYLKTVAPGANWPEYFVTDARVVDLSHAALGREAPSPTRALPVTLDLEGMTAWTVGDRLEIGSSSVATTLMEAPELEAGTTVIASYQLDWQHATGPLMRGTPQLPRLVEAERDDLHILHWDVATAEDNGDPLTVSTIEDVYSSDAITLRDGEAAAVGGRFSRVVADPRRTVTFDGDGYERAFADDGSTTARDVAIVRGVVPTLGVNADGVQPIVRFDIEPYRPAGIRTLSSSPRNPFPASWDHVVMTQYTRRRSLMVPGAVYAGWCFSHTTSTVPAVSDFTATPYVAAARNITIGGNSGEAGGAAAFDRRGLAIAWDAVDRADYYAVRVYHLYLGDEVARKRFLGDFFTTGTSVVVPSELLLDGERYVFAVTSYRGYSGYASGALRRDSIPSGWTRACTAAVRVSSTCGDGDVDAGEDCDDGAAGSATCDTDCTAVVCGDGLRNPDAPEVCDTVEDSDSCDADCTAVECGDGHVNLMHEVCDDGNDDDGDGCSANCQVATPVTPPS